MNLVLTRIFVILILSFAVSPALFAEEPVRSAEGDVKQFVLDLSSKALSTIKDKSISDQDKERELGELFDQYVDAAWMAKFVMGKYYRTLNDKQKDRYISLYDEYLTQNYVPKFKEYSGENLEVLRIRKTSDVEHIVHTKLKSSSGPSILVDYRVMRDEFGKLRVIDIVGEGISLIITQRSDFGGLISRKGVAYFIDKLEGKVKKSRVVQAAKSDSI